MRTGGLPTAFIGDSHFLPGDAVVDLFLEFLGTAPSRFERLVLAGDIFDLWLARTRLHEEHHLLVLSALAEARTRGLIVDYVVGNRDFGVEDLPGAPFDRIATHLLAEAGEAPTWICEHGDLINRSDRQYRAWRAFSRSSPVLGTFLRLPPAVSLPASRWLERRMRTTNLAYKRAFPHEQARGSAELHFERTGARALILGHFHQELRFPAGAGEVLVLPSWKVAQRHAELDPATKELRFVESL